MVVVVSVSCVLVDKRGREGESEMKHKKKWNKNAIHTGHVKVLLCLLGISTKGGCEVDINESNLKGENYARGV